MYIIRRIDTLLNAVTMYLLVVIGLSILSVIGIFFSFIGVLSLSTTGMLASFGILMTVGYITNQVLIKLYNAPANTYSSLITTLILFCILPPVTSWERAGAAVTAVVIAIASKYILAIHNKHIFNPAAVGALSINFLNIGIATWWIGSADMLPFTLLFGLLLVRKLRRFRLVLSFTVAALVVMLLLGVQDGESTSQVLRTAFSSWPLVFFGTVMLTEPSTMPPTDRLRIIYGFLVGALFASRIDVGPLHSSPETVLLAGNLFAYAVSPKHKLRLKLKERREIGKNLYDLSFVPSRTLTFKPGQYLEWTLPHKKADSRGNRRTFTIASSPTETEIHLGIKVYDPSSSFKQALLAMKPGQKIAAGQLAGDFLLPNDVHQKLVFIAGGIGITPFRSMLQYMNDTNEKRDVTLFYNLSAPDQIAYQSILESNAKTVYVLGSKDAPKTWQGEVGFLNEAMIKKHAPAYLESTFYLSGPNAMVDNYKRLLRSLGVPKRKIITDYFAGY